MSSLFEAYIQNGDGSSKTYIPFDSFTSLEELNNDRACEVFISYQNIKEITDTLGLTIKQFFSNAYRELIVSDVSSNTVYSGFVKNLSARSQRDEAPTIRISSKGFFSLLEKRYTDLETVVTYSQQDLSDIAWDLINDTQTLSTTGADFGITRGTDPTTRNADRTYTRKIVADAIQGLSNNNVNDGIDFDIDINKVFNVYYPERGSRRDNIILEDGVNCDAVEYEQPLVGDMANEVTAVGEGDGTDAIYATKTSIDTYKTNYYLLQELISAKDVVELDTLEEKAQNYLDIFQFPRDFISATHDFRNPDIQQYGVGDRIRLKIPRFDVDGYFRVIRREINDEGVVKLDFSSR